MTLPRWLDLWPAEREKRPNVDRWCTGSAGLGFNPFGPEAAENDAFLPAYWVDTFSAQTQGARATLVLGAPGSGQTAAARLLAYHCVHPADQPREEGAFPVYWNPSAADSPRSLVEGLVKAAARFVARYLTDEPWRFIELQEPRKYRIADLLIAWTGSKENLVRELRRQGPEYGTPDVLLHSIADCCPNSVPALSAELLIDAWPTPFKCFYLILDGSAVPIALPMSSRLSISKLTKKQMREMIEKQCPTEEEVRTLCFDVDVNYDDLPGSTRQSKIIGLIAHFQNRGCLSELLQAVGESTSVRTPPLSTADLCSLFERAAVLANRGLYLKLFLPQAIEAELSNWGATHLNWSNQHLAHMLQARLKAAGIEDIMQLCAHDVPAGLDTRLIQAAQGSPRRLIRLGNRLLAAQAEHDLESPRFSVMLIDRVLDSTLEEE